MVLGIPVVQDTQDTCGCFRDVLYFFIHILYISIVEAVRSMRTERDARNSVTTCWLQSQLSNAAGSSLVKVNICLLPSFLHKPLFFSCFPRQFKAERHNALCEGGAHDSKRVRRAAYECHLLAAFPGSGASVPLPKPSPCSPRYFIEHILMG